MDNAYRGEGETICETETDVDTFGIARTHTEQDVKGKARGVAAAKGIAEGVTEGPMVQPTAPYQELSSVTIEPLATQLHRFFADLVRQPRQHAMIATGKEPPVSFRVADVPDPVFTERQALVLDLDMMDAHNFFQTAEEIEHDIAERRRALVRTVEVVTVDTASAIERRRRARRNASVEEVA